MCVATFFTVLAAFICFVSCEDECGQPPEVPRARVSDAPDNPRYVVGSIVTYECDAGFISGGVQETSKCVEDTETHDLVWSKAEITCRPRSCGDPGDVANARRSGYVFTFPNHVEFICNEGYRLSGAPRRYCEASGVWSGRLPSCRVVTCPRPTDPDNGRAVYTSLEYNSQLTYECNRDLQLSSSQSRKCGPNGEWTGTEPVCREIECGLPDKPAFGTMTLVGNKAKVGSLVTYKCNPGRILVGSSTSKCMKTGEWTFPSPRCVEPCNVPSVPNGKLGRYEEEYLRWERISRTVFKEVYVGSTLTENEQVILRCNNNYVPRAQTLREITVTCLDGQLLPEPECVSTSCMGDAPPIQNGAITVSSRRNGDTIRYSCNRGFERSSDGVLTCRFGTWTGNPPTCIDIRCHKESLDYPGLLKVTGFVYNGRSFEPTCDRGYEVSDKSDSKISCNKGEWSGNLPPCTKARCRKESLRRYYGLILSGQEALDDGESLQPVCSEGFEFSNKRDSSIYCREGNWEGNLPPCSPAPCLNNPTVPENGKIKLIRARDHGSVTEYECFPFYIMEGENRVECRYGKWTGSPPTCKDTRCNKESLDYPGLPKLRGFVYNGQWFEPTCDHGYTVSKKYDSKIYCNKGEWTGNLPPCTGARCRTESLRGYNGIILSGQAALVDGESLQPVCSEGFEFSNKSDSSIYCRQGNWEGNLPPCSPTHCLNDPPVPENGKVKLIRATDHGAVTDYECILFYTMEQVNQVECRNGKWTGSPPTCKDSRCYLRNLPEKDGVDLSVEKRVFYSQEKADIICERGYDLKYPEVRCVRGEWQTQNELSPCQEAKVQKESEDTTTVSPIIPPNLEQHMPNRNKNSTKTVDDDRQANGAVGENDSTNITRKVHSGPCDVSYVRNGELGRYEEGYLRSQRKSFRKVSLGSTLNENEQVFLRCNENYMPRGRVLRTITVTCLDGQLSPEPECVSTSCMGDAPAIQNGEAIVASRAHGYTIRYRCNEGFERAGEGAVACKHGTWTGNPPTCVDTRCSRESLNYPGLVVRGTGFAHDGWFFEPACHPGYEVSEKSDGKIYCDKGEWTGNLSPCTRAGTDFRVEVREENEDMTTVSPTHRSSLEPHMPNRNENSTITVGDDRQSNGAVEETDSGNITRKKNFDECGQPPVVNRTRVSDAPDNPVYVVGDIVTYECDPGFISGGTQKTSKCVRDTLTEELVWSKPKITCAPRSCGDPGDVPNARRSGYLFTFPNHVEYICNDGYRVSGQSRRYCEASGVWSGRLPSCRAVTCPRPTDLDDGRAVYTSLEFGSQLTYECNNDLQLSSRQPRMCGPNGEWTGTKPVCRETECELPDKPAFGTMELVGNKAKVGSLIIYKCDRGRKLVGSSNSKCTRTGEWTFPTPKCVEPCYVPSVSNGELGRYEEEYLRRERRWRNVFIKVSMGSTIDENEQVILRCDADYVPRSQPLRETSITCLDGQLSPEPECITISCMGDAPAIQNGEPRVSSRRHGYTIWYKCNPESEKEGTGNVTCNYGTWIGNPPACVDSRCNKDSLNYPGLVKGTGFVSNGQSFEPTCFRGYDVFEKSDTKIYCTKGEWTGNLPPCTTAQCKTESLLGFSGVILSGKDALDDGERLQPICSEGFEFSNKEDSSIYCRQGNWEGNLPPCSPAHCLNDPPVPENGKIKLIRAIGHGADIEYECLKPYVMEGENRVECKYGKWTGSPPTCKDSRCDLRNLPEKDGVNLADGTRIFYSSGKADIICEKGYNLRYPEVRCERGEWQTENTLSPCQEDNCLVNHIDNGEMFEQKSRTTRNLIGWPSGTETFYESVPIGSSGLKGAYLYVRCSVPYSFQGQGNEGLAEVVCRRGEWTPFPVCLLAGTDLVVERKKVDEEMTTVSPIIQPNLEPHKPNRNKNSTKTVDADSKVNGGVEENDPRDITGKDHVDENFDLAGNNSTAGNREELESTTTVSPSCSCKYIYNDDNLVAFDGTRVLQFNDEVHSGTTVRFYCKEPGFYHFRGPEALKCPEDCSWHSAMFPSCVYPNNDDISIRVSADPVKNMNVGVGGVITVIPGTRFQLSCSIPSRNYKGAVEWATTAAAAGLLLDGVYYNPPSYRLFYILSAASNRHSGIYTCYRTRAGSRSVVVEVRDVQCPEIRETEGLAISYSQDRRFSSNAMFHCLPAYKRNGLPYVTCEASGMWSGPTPTCDIPTCSMNSLFEVIPQGVVPYIDESVPEYVPYEYTLKLRCEDAGMVVKGDTTATCTREGKWKAEPGVRCVPGCPSLQKKDGSELIISPDKEYYSMGETIAFLCPDKKKLTEDVERIMCFNTGWTPNIVPDCQ